MVADHDKHVQEDDTENMENNGGGGGGVGGRGGEGRGGKQHLYQFTSALLPADDAPQRPSSVQPLQMRLMALSN